MGIDAHGGSGDYYDFSLFDPVGNGIMLVPRGTLQVLFGGDIGVGTAPSARLHVHAPNSNGYAAMFKDLVATEGYGNGVLLDMQGNSMVRVSNMQFGLTGMAVIDATGQALSLNRNAQQDVVIGRSTYTTRLRVESTGTSTFTGAVSVAQNLDVTGNIVASGNIAAKYQDVAEWVPASADLAPGTVVVLDRDANNTVRASSTPYDTGVAGVVSEQPGLLLGEAGGAKEMIATTGRVRVRVDATRQPIAIGDLLVTSGTSGVAMKSMTVDVAGISMHRPGTIIGKALEPLPSGEGDILVLLSLQ